MPNSEITVQGQAWDQVSLARFGSEKQMSALLPVNVDEIDALLFEGGIVLEIPAIEPMRVKSVPPWEKMK